MSICSREGAVEYATSKFDLSAAVFCLADRLDDCLKFAFDRWGAGCAADH